MRTGCATAELSAPEPWVPVYRGAPPLSLSRSRAALASFAASAACDAGSVPSFASTLAREGRRLEGKAHAICQRCPGTQALVGICTRYPVAGTSERVTAPLLRLLRLRACCGAVVCTA